MDNQSIRVFYGVAREVPADAVEFARTLDQGLSLVERIRALREVHPMDLAAARGVFDLLKDE